MVHCEGDVTVQIAFASYLQKYRIKTDALYLAIKDAIINGTLPLHTKLASTRLLAEQYGLSRGIVTQVYDMLLAEGYVTARSGQGTFVAYRYEQPAEPPRPMHKAALSKWGERVRQLRKNQLGDGYHDHCLYPFHWGHTDMSEFPVKEWNRCMHASLRQMQEDGDVSLRDPQGDPALREAIAAYLLRNRGFAAAPSQIVIVNGSTQAITLLAQLLVEPGMAAVSEEIGYAGVKQAVAAAGARWLPAEIDGSGIIPGSWEARLLFVTPTRQFPTGAVLNLERRQQLLQWAQEREAIIVEDEYDSEFRHKGKPLEPLKALDRRDRVVYIGSFSKAMPSYMRIGYAVLPKALAEPFCAAKELYEPRATGAVEQKALAEFMKSGAYDRHLRRMKRIYGSRFELLRRLLPAELPDLFEWVESDTGLHIFGWWRDSEERYERYAAICRAEGVRWAVARHGKGGTEGLVAGGAGNEDQANRQAAVRIGCYFHFIHMSLKRLEQGVAVMKAASETLNK
jgi:GntR family transcriptional regulator/MocR family aminotransferase